MDLRSARYLLAFPADTPDRTGNQPVPGAGSMSLCWLRDHDPHCYRKARWALQPKDWLRLRMGGQAASEPSEGTGALLADRQGRWDAELIQSLDLSFALFAPMVESNQAAGAISRAAANDLGLPDSVALIAGAAETAAAALGSGVLRSGDAQLTTCSGGQIVVMSAECPPDTPGLNVFRSANRAPYAPWYVMAAMHNVGVALE